MNRKLIPVLFLLCTAPMPGSAATLTIGVDLSGSNPLLKHENFAHGAASWLETRLSALQNGDHVRLLTFGARADAANLLDHTLTISRRQRAAKVAAGIAGFIRSLPTLEGKDQASTNLIAWLEFTHGFDCQAGGQIIVLTDGLEASSYVDPNALLEGKAGLPQAEVDLSGCQLTFYGLGAGFPPQGVKHIRSAWQEWAGQAGAAFDAVIR